MLFCILNRYYLIKRALTRTTGYVSYYRDSRRCNYRGINCHGDNRGRPKSGEGGESPIRNKFAELTVYDHILTIMFTFGLDSIVLN